MTALRTAAQQALEALKMMLDEYGEANCPACDHADAAIYALKEALVEDAMQKFTDVNQELEAALAEHDKNLAGFKERKANWDIRAPRSPRDLQCKLAEETQERDKQQRVYEEQRIHPLAEPVAWMFELARNFNLEGYGGWEKRITEYRPNTPEGSVRNVTPLYTAPPQRKPLTEEELYSLFRTVASPVMFARAIERAHGIT